MKIKNKSFGNLIVKTKPTHIELHAKSKNISEISFDLKKYNTFPNNFLLYLQEQAHLVWKKFEPKEATSDASDWYSFYDSRSDSEGEAYYRDGILTLFSPTNDEETTLLYHFNKRRMESFMFDMNNVFGEYKACAFCNGTADLNDTANSDFQINLDLTDENEPRIQANFDNNEYCTGYESFVIRYCPMCGRKLV